MSDSLTSSIEPESKQPALSERELLDLYESPDLFKSIVGGDAFNTIEEIDPDYVNKFIVSNYLSESHNINNAQILGNYQSYAKSIGLTGIPANDANDIASDIRRTQRLSLQEVEPVTFTEGVSGAAQRGVQNLSQSYSLMGISDPTYQSLIDGKLSEINQLDRILGSELNVKVKERARRQQESAKQFIAGTLLLKSNEIKNFIDAQSKIESAKLSEGYKSFVDSGNIPTSPKAFGEFLVGFMTEQSVQQAPTALKTMASGFAGSPAVLATVFSESLHQERAFEMMQHLRESGINFDDQESLNAALSNDKLMSDAMLRGMNKSLPIAITSALSAYLPIKGKTALGKLGREVVTQAGLDSIGEVLGQSFATGEVDMQEVMLEVLGGTTQSVAEFSTKIAANVAKSPINSILKNEDGSIKSRKEVVALSEYLPDDFAEEMSEVDPVTGNLVVEATRGNSEAYDSLVSIIRSVEETEVEVSPELKKLSDAVNELENINIEIQTEFEFTEEDVRDAKLKEFKEREIVKGRPARITTQEKIANLKEKQEESRRRAKDAASERFSKMESRYKEKVAKLEEEAKELKVKNKQAWVNERADVKELSKQVQEFLNVLPPASRGKVKFVRKMANATTVDSRLKVLQGIVDRVNGLIDEDFVKGRKTLLRTVVKKATKGDAKAVSKRLGPNAEIVQKIDRIIKSSAEDNQAAMLEELSQLPEDSEEGRAVSTLYNAFSNINAKDPKQLNASIALVEEIIKYGKEWRGQFTKKKLAELRKLRGDFFEEIDVIDPVKEEKALPEAEIKRLIKKDDPTVAKKATRDYDLLSSPFIEGYDGPRPTDTSIPEYSSFHYVVSNNQQQKLNAAIASGAVDNLANQVATEATEMMKDPSIAAGIGWYGRMRKRLGAIFGKDINTFTQLLGTTSAQTPVETNFRYSVNLYNRFKSGEFDSKIKKYLRLYGQMKAGTLGDLLLKDRVKNSKGVLYTPEMIKKSSGSALLSSAAEHYDLLPRQTSGKLYGTNSYPALKALAQVWFDEKLAKNKMTPKTPQFTMNLNGESLEATIDVWAARLLRRVIYKGQENARILPSQETAVSNPDFALGQLVFRRAAQKLNLNPDDLQALVWFGEKQIWDKNGWTGAAGALKSSFDTPADVFYPVDGSTRSEADANLILDFLAAERIINRDINFPDAVQPTRQIENRKKYDKFLRQSVISDYLKSRGSGAIYESVSVESNRKRQVTRSIDRLSSYRGKVSYKSGTGKEPKGSFKVVKRGPVLNENRFSRIAKANKDGNKFGSSVDVFKPSDYKGYDLIITSSKPGESVTISISPEGEVGSVTKSPGAAAKDVHAAFDMAFSTGKVRFLNGFETILPDKYAKYGFTPVARLKFNPEFQPEGWSTATYNKYNGGQPDVVFMRFDGTVGSEYNPTGFPEVNTYEEGIRLATQEDVTAQAADLKEDDPTKSQQELIPEFLSNIKDSKELTQEQKEFVEKIQEMGHNLEFSKSDGRVIEGKLHGTAQKGPKGKSIITIADGLVPDQQIHSIGHELVHAQLAKLSPDLRSRVFSMVKELVNDKSFINAVKENWDLEKGSRGDLQAFEEILAEHGGRVLTRNKSTLGNAFNKVEDLFYKVSKIIIDLAEFAFRGKSSLKLDDLASAIIDLDVDRIESITADQEVTVIAGYPESDIQLSFFKQKKKRKPDVLLSKQDLETKRNLAGVFGEWLEGADWYISTLDGIEQLIENLIRVPGTQYAGKLHDQITKPAFKASEKFLTRQRTMRESAFDSFNKVLKDQGLNPEQIKDLFMGLRKPPNFEKGDSTGVYFESQFGYGVKEQPITKDQGIQLWMWRQDKTLQGSFDTMQWTDDVDAQLNSYIGEEGIALGKYMMSVYKKLGVEMNDVLFEVEGWKLPIIENYSPVSKHAKNAVLDIEEAMKDGIVKSTAKNNSMKLRVDEKAALDATRGALEVFDKHISEMNHYITHGEVAKRMENLFDDDRVKRAITQIYGPQRVRLIKHMIENFTRGGIDYGRIDPFVSKLIRNVAVGKLAINFPSAVKQLGSVPAYANAMPAKEWSAGFLSFFKNASSNIKILLETDYIKNRITTTGDRDLRSIAESKSFQQAAMGAKNWRDRLMILTRLGDVGAIMAGGWPIYKKTYDEAIAAGKSIEEAKEMAEFEFGFVSDRSQQSSKPQNLSYFQSIGSFAKLFTMFMTSPIQYQRIVNSAIRSWRKGRVDLPTAMKTVAIYHIILPQIFTAMGSMGLGLFSDDEEKQEAWLRRQAFAAVLGNLNAFFLAGDALEALLGSIIKDEQFYDLSNPVVSELSSIVKSAANIDKEGNLSDLVGSMLLLLGGIPYNTISREFEAKYELLQGDDVYQNIWGISDYAAFETKKKKKKKKSTSSYYFD